MKNKRLRALIGASALALTLSFTSNVEAASKYATTTANLNFRTGPSTSNKIISTIKKGTKVEVISKNGKWTKIKYNNKEGYSSSEYLKEISSSTEGSTSGATTTQSIGTVTASTLNIRSGASTSSSIVTRAKKGEKVTILESKNGWYRVKLSNGKIGWGSGQYITVENIQPEQPTQPPVVAPPVQPEHPIQPPVVAPPVQPEQPSYTINEVNTNYDLSFDEYAQLQNQKNTKYSIDEYKKYMDVNQANNKLQFLRIDTYRDIDATLLNSKLAGKGVLEGQGQNIANAAKSKNIDPVYFIAQSILETGHGKSALAQGITITEIADESKPIYKTDEEGNKILDSNGKEILIGYEMIPLSQPTTVYNLYGIGAKDNLPEFKNRARILGTTYAYNKGWTSVEAAINGAASFVADNYIHSSKYNQNTVYKFRFNPSKQYIWHQYATDVAYADKVGKLMEQFKDVYTGREFTLDIPIFKETSTYSRLNIDINKIDDTHISIGDITNY